MPILSLHQCQVTILKALCSATRILGMTDHLTIVGSMGRFLAGESMRVGDIDVMISNALCTRYWDFLEILSLHGVISVWDVLDRPRFPWSYCRPAFGHALSLTIDCSANWKELPYGNLDVMLTASDLHSVPDSSRWVDLIWFKDFKPLDQAARNQKIKNGHEAFVSSLNKCEESLAKAMSSRAFHSELGLHFCGK